MKVWLITGCSSGFGREIALAALKKGDIVLATCRGDVSRLEDLQKAGATPLVLDISASPEVINGFAEKVLNLPQVKGGGGVDILVNNAGYVTIGAVEEISPEEFIKSFNTNFLGHVTLTQALLPQFRERRSGTIAFIGSRSGYMRYPGVSAYSIAKYAIAGLSETLSVELESFNIRVTCIEPGDFRTTVFKENNVKYTSKTIKEYENTAVGATRDHLSAGFDQPGDPVKGSQRIVDVLKGEWPGSENLPVRLALGEDAFESVKEMYGRRLKENEEWRDWICNVNFD